MRNTESDVARQNKDIATIGITNTSSVATTFAARALFKRIGFFTAVAALAISLGGHQAKAGAILDGWRLNLSVANGLPRSGGGSFNGLANVTNIDSGLFDGFSTLTQTVQGGSALNQPFLFSGSIDLFGTIPEGGFIPTSLAQSLGTASALYFDFTGLTGTLHGDATATLDQNSGSVRLILDSDSDRNSATGNILELAQFNIVAPSGASDFDLFGTGGPNSTIDITLEQTAGISGLYTDNNGVDLAPGPFTMHFVNVNALPTMLDNSGIDMSGNGVSIISLQNAGQYNLAESDEVIWDGGTDSSWTTGSNWDNGTGPGIGDNVLIDGGKTGTASSVSLDTGAAIGHLTIDTGDKLTIETSGSLSVTGANNNGTLDSFGSLTNTGTFNNNSGNTLALKAGSTFDNTGGVLNNNNNGVIDLGIDLTLGSAAAGTVNLNTGSTLNIKSGAALTNQAGPTRFNNGAINTETGGTFVNAGAFNNTGGTITNNAGGTIANVAGGTINNLAGGTITNNAGGTIANVAGGTINNVAGGTINNNGTFDNNGSFVNSDAMLNTGNFTIAAGATMTGAGTYTQTAGALTIDGTMTQENILFTGGSFGGTGTINGNVMCSGCTVGPGNSPGTLTINGDLIIDTGILALEEGDILDVSGMIQIGAGVEVDIFFDGVVDSIIDIADFFAPGGSQPVFDDFASNVFNVFTNDIDNVGQPLTVTVQFGLDTISVTPAATLVSEPGTLAVFAIGLAGLGYARRRQKAA